MNLFRPSRIDEKWIRRLKQEFACVAAAWRQVCAIPMNKPPTGRSRSALGMAVVHGESDLCDARNRVSWTGLAGVIQSTGDAR
jgi:hypothetical protein